MSTAKGDPVATTSQGLLPRSFWMRVIDDTNSPEICAIAPLSTEKSRLP